MSYKPSQNEITDLINANYPLIQVISDDDIPVIKTFIRMVDEEFVNTKYDVVTWNIASGFFTEYGKETKSGFMVERHKPLEEKVEAMYNFIKQCKEHTIFILQDFDFVLKEHKHLSFGLKEIVQTITHPLNKENMLKKHKTKSAPVRKHIVISAAEQYIPKELDKLMSLVYFGMPGREVIEDIIKTVSENTEKPLTEIEFEKVVNASYGLTEVELTNALFKSIANPDIQKIDAAYIASVKKQVISKGGVIEYTDPIQNGIKTLGGMKSFKSWIEKREIAFDEKTRIKRNLQFPKGVLLTGIQGGGKSHAAKSVPGYLGLPLLRLDIGKVKGMYVGQSEENMRKAIKLAESVSPCVLWLDEIEKAFPDPRNANTHEVSKGLLGYFLTWMQEKDKPVFVIATANNIDSLPPELLRKGRFDEIFWVDLPDLEGRKEITKISLKEIGVSEEEIDVEKVAEASNGYTGAEIKAAINEANFNSAYDEMDLSTKYILEEIEKTTPISVIRKDSIEEMQKWAKKNKVRNAS